MRLLSSIALLGATATGLALVPNPTASSFAQTSKPAEASGYCRVHVEIPPLSLHQIAATATDIVHGRVHSVRSVDPAVGYGYTEIVLEEIEALKGSRRARSVVRIAGNHYLGGRTIVPASPQFASGEEVILFLESIHGSEEFGVLGLTHGTYRVSRDPATNRAEANGVHASSRDLDQFFAEVIDLAVQPLPTTSR